MERNAAVTASRKVLPDGGNEEPGAGSTRVLLPAGWILLSGLVLAADRVFTPGSSIQFPVAFIIPTVLAARFSGPWWGIAVAFALPLARFFPLGAAHASWTAAEAIVGAVLQIDILLFVVLAAVRERQRSRLLREVESLRGALCVCTSCRNIRGREGLWMPALEYAATCSEGVFRHGICPECVRAYLDYLLRRDVEARAESADSYLWSRHPAERDHGSAGIAGDRAGPDVPAYAIPSSWAADGPVTVFVVGPAGDPRGHAIAAAETSSK